MTDHARAAIRKRVKRALAAAVTLSASLLTVFPSTVATAVAEPANGAGEIQATLLKQFEESGGEPQGFWIKFAGTADTTAAREITDWAERGRSVYRLLSENAQEAQAETIRVLEATGVEHQPYWITNAIWVESGTLDLATAMAARDGVEQILAPVTYEAPEPVKTELTDSKLGTNAEGAVEWGIANIKADQVWERYGVRGDGIVVANIDSGVEFDHPALVNSYRGHNGDGTIDNDYNWFDVTGNSPNPSDGNGHGTHTMGTMLGDDGAANRIGVAPGATWIAANGCATCANDHLIASAQWMLAPTRTDGTGADPAKRPHIVNNSWGSTTPSNDPFMEDVLQAWADAGIMGVWSNGNNGSRCGTSSSPGSRTLNYSVGAYDSANTVAGFSSRGSGQDGEIKPNISAPGVGVRSSYVDNRYASANGTSMAAPHAAGAVALLWAADRSLVGDIAATRRLLDDTAIDTADDQCGGTADDNNVYGEGRLDALALVEATGQADYGTLTGTVTNSATGAPVQGAAIRLVAGDVLRSARTGDDGVYSASIPAGTYEATVTAFGHEAGVTTVTVTAGTTTTANIVLTALPGYTISGRVVNDRTGFGVPGLTVTIAGSPYSATTDATGHYAVQGVHGPRSYLLSIDPGICGDRAISRTVTVEGDLTMPTLTLASRPIDGATSREFNNYNVRGLFTYPYACFTEPSTWTDADQPVELVDDRDRHADVALPFEFRYMGWPIDKVRAFENGSVYFHAPTDRDRPVDPAMGLSLAADMTFLARADTSGVFTRASGQAPNRTFTIEWRDVCVLSGFGCSGSLSAQMTLHENGDVVLAAKNIDPNDLVERGMRGITEVGSRLGSPTSWACCVQDNLNYHTRAWRSDDTQVRIDLADAGLVVGTVTDTSTGRPIPGASVDVTDKFGRLVWRYKTDANGRYEAEIFTGQQYRITAIKPGGYPRAASTVAQISTVRETTVADLRLESASPRITPDSVDLSDGSETVRITNGGREPYQWEAALRVSDPAAPTPGSRTGRTQLPPKTGVLTVAIEEHEGSWWVSETNLNGPGNPYYVREYTADGQPTGNAINLDHVDDRLGLAHRTFWAHDLAYVDATGQLCMVAGQGAVMPGVETQNDIVCVRVATGEISVIETGLPNNQIPNGLGYDESDDVFFLQHQPDYDANEAQGATISTVAGPRHANPGQIVSSCVKYGTSNYGLAYHEGSESIWVLSGIQNMRMWASKVDPATCIETDWVPLDSVRGGRAPSGDIRPDGTLFVLSGWTPDVYQFATGDRLTTDLPWLHLSQTSGTQDKGKATEVEITVDQAAIPDGVDRVDLVLRGNSGQRSPIEIPLHLTGQSAATPPR